MCVWLQEMVLIEEARPRCCRKVSSCLRCSWEKTLHLSQDRMNKMQQQYKRGITTESPRTVTPGDPRRKKPQLKYQKASEALPEFSLDPSAGGRRLPPPCWVRSCCVKRLFWCWLGSYDSQGRAQILKILSTKKKKTRKDYLRDQLQVTRVKINERVITPDTSLSEQLVLSAGQAMIQTPSKYLWHFCSDTSSTHWLEYIQIHLRKDNKYQPSSSEESCSSSHKLLYIVFCGSGGVSQSLKKITLMTSSGLEKC